MKIARFAIAGADPRYGILDGDDFVVLDGDPMFSGFDTTGERVPAAQAKLLAPVIPRSKVVGVTAEGVVYLKPNTAVIGPDDAIVLPSDGKATAQGALAVVIGSIAKRVQKRDAASVVFGCSIGKDVAATDQLAAGQEAIARGYDTFAPLGPVMETEYEISDDVAQLIAFVSEAWTLLPGDVILVPISEPPTPLSADGWNTVGIEGIGTLKNPVRARA